MTGTAPSLQLSFVHTINEDEKRSARLELLLIQLIGATYSRILLKFVLVFCLRRFKNLVKYIFIPIMFTSSIGKKYLMALTGIVLIGFVFVHMAGNLQILMGPEKINAYAHALQSLPLPILWGSRVFLLVCVVLHAWTAIVLIRENRAARPRENDVEVTKRAGFSSLKMGLTGTILLFFIVFHLLHFTVRTVYPEYNDLMTTVGAPEGMEVHNVYSMVLAGFQHTWVSIFYVVSMFLLCGHLGHGFSSVFQSLGIRSESWRIKIDWAAKGYAWLIFLGFSIVPILVIGQKFDLISFFEPSLFSEPLAMR